MGIQNNLKAAFGLNESSLVREIQRDALEEALSASALMRKARLAANKLGLSEFQQWISNESDGYQGTLCSNLPRYRHIGVSPKFFNPYRGWCPIIIEDQQIYDLCHTGFLY